MKEIKFKQKKTDKESYHEKLVKSGAIDLTNNCRIIDLGNGYCKIETIDENKKVK